MLSLPRGQFSLAPLPITKSTVWMLLPGGRDGSSSPRGRFAAPRQSGKETSIPVRMTVGSTASRLPLEISSGNIAQARPMNGSPETSKSFHAGRSVQALSSRTVLPIVPPANSHTVKVAFYRPSTPQLAIRCGLKRSTRSLKGICWHRSNGCVFRPAKCRRRFTVELLENCLTASPVRLARSP